ncbi:MAG: FtsX-like permease family protein [Betaproteobacteria bacterium]|nr:FtsX-like permease family protein [Betaproteobacteria bacterium]
MLRLFALLNARFSHRRGRVLLSLAGIALGVALGFTVHLINHAALEEFGAAVRALAGEADLEVRGGRSGFDEGLYATLARLPGVAVASPVLEIDAGLAGSESTLKLIALDPLRAAQVQPALFGEDPRRIFALLRPDAVMLSAGAARALGLDKGSKLRLVAGMKAVEFDVAGVLPEGSLRGRAVLADLATAQWRLNRLGNLNRIDLRLQSGADREAMPGRVAALLPAGVHVASVETIEEQGAKLSRSYRVNLNVLALVALFTGGFLVFSAQALEVARRRGEHGLLRVLGLRRGQLAGLVLTEAAALGVIGSALGLCLGYLLARVAVHAAGADLGAGMFRGLAPEIVVPSRAAIAFFATGIAVSLAGALLPALDAARAEPARALKAGDEQRMFERLMPIWPGCGLLVLGAAMTRPGPVDGIPVFGYISIAAILVGSILLLPRVSTWAFARLGVSQAMPAFVPITLALSQLRGSPGQAVVSLAAIVASFSLMVAMAIMVASFRESVDDWLRVVLPADFYLRTSHQGDTAFLDSDFEARVKALTLLSRAEFARAGRVTLDPARPAIALLARDTEVGAEKWVPLVGPRHPRRPGDPPDAWVSEAVAEIYGVVPGSRIELPLEGKNFSFLVAGIWRDYARQHGAIVIDRKVYVALTGDRRSNDAALWLAPGAAPADVASALRALPGGANLEMAEPGEIRRISLAVFDRSFAVTYLLEAVAVVVGLFGLSSSLGAIVLARRREFGMLRHIGMTRARIGAMLAAEGGLLAAFGAVAGLAVGWVISLILIHVVNRQSFNWGMELHPPYALLASLTAVLVVLAVITAVLSGREAMGMGPVRAVREDW